MTKYVTPISLVCLILLSACVQVTPVEADKSTQLAVSSATDMQVSYEEGDGFALTPQYLEEVSISETEQKNIYDIYGKAIANNMRSKGFVDASSKESARFNVGYGIALSKDLSDSKINEIFGVTPGLPSIQSFEKGSFLVYVEDVSMQKIVWRGTVQGFAQNHLTPAERADKTQTIVDSVLKQFNKEK